MQCRTLCVDGIKVLSASAGIVDSPGDLLLAKSIPVCISAIVGSLPSCGSVSQWSISVTTTHSGGTSSQLYTYLLCSPRILRLPAGVVDTTVMIGS
jgi:hypothetical protein